MKTMSCRQPDGACDEAFHADPFEAIAELSKQHGMEMSQKNDQFHLAAMDKTQELMQSPEAMVAWYEKKKEFDAWPDE